MRQFSKIMVYILAVFMIFTYMSANAFATRATDEIEVYKMGNNSITIKWTPYNSGGQIIEKYRVGYSVHNEGSFTYLDVSSSFQSPDYNSINNEFTKKIQNLQSNTIYDITLDVYIAGTPVGGAYNSISTITKIVIDKSIDIFNNPYGNDDVGHIDFAFVAPNEFNGGVISSVSENEIEGYDILVSDTQGEIYSSGQPYRIKYDGLAGINKIYRVSGGDQDLTYNGTQFEFANGTINGKDLLTFSLYKTNQPSADNFGLAKVYYVTIKPVFKTGSIYEDVITSATANYETIETIGTLLPLTITQVSDELVRLEFPQVSSGSMSYEIYRGRISGSLTKIHTEYDDGLRPNILYYNKLSNLVDGDVYFYKVTTLGPGIKSKEISITMNVNPNIAPVLNNIQVEKILTDKTNDTADIIISWDKPLNEDSYADDLSYRVYLNTDSKNQVQNNDVAYDLLSNILLDENGKVVLNTKTDINNSNILYNGYPVVFERITQFSPTDLNGVGTVYAGNDPVGNFLSTGQNYYTISRDGVLVIRTMYRINGSSFLSNIDVPSVLGQPHTIYDSNLEGELPTDYKDSIDLNTTYFIKMDTFNSSVLQKSDYSTTTSFTTPQNIVDTVPIPDNFNVEIIEMDKIGFVWDMLSDSVYDDTDVTYEIFISENGSYDANDFYMIKDPVFTTVLDKKHYLIDTDYTLEDDLPKQIQSNKTYIFKIGTRWNTTDDKGNIITLYSNLGKILAVTTKRTQILDPDVNTPLAPIDFIITDLKSKSVSFQWTEVDDNSTYRIVRTPDVIDPFAFLSITGNGVVSGFINSNGIYTYADPSLSANTLYYFSIRSEAIVEGQTLFSPWITLPVTTILVEEPMALSLVNRSDDGHSIKISWKGKANLNYEIVTKDDSTKNYSLAYTYLGDVNDSNDKTFEYTISGLSSNTQYLIKVRAKDISTYMVSKYCQSILVRTEFNQEDYDEEIEDEEKLRIISDVAKDWQNSAVEEIGYNDTQLEIWIKEDKSSKEAENTPENNYVIDLSQRDEDNKSIHIPLDLVTTLQEKSNTLEIKLESGSIFIKPGILDTQNLGEKLDFEYVKNKIINLEVNKVKEEDVKLLINDDNYIASDMVNVSLKLIGYKNSIEELNDSITQRIDNLINAQQSIIEYKNIEGLREDIAEDIQREVKNAILQSYIAETTITIPEDNKLRIEMPFILDKSGLSDKYVVYLKSGLAQKEIQGTVVDNKIQFETTSLGKIVVLGKKSTNDIKGNVNEEEIRKLILEYDFSNELSNGNFKPNNYATKKDALQFFINVLDHSNNNENLTLIQKAQKIGITDGYSLLDLYEPITREEVAYLAAKAYENETGIEIDKINIGQFEIQDSNIINEKYIKYIQMVLELKIMDSSNNQFIPSKEVTRAQVASILVKVLESIERLK